MANAGAEASDREAGSPPTLPAMRTSARVRARTVAVLGALTAIVAIDLLTKVWVVAALPHGRRVHVIGDTVEVYVSRNPGGAFGRFRGLTPVLAVAAVVVAVLLVRAVRRANDRVVLAGLVLVLGGALGNLVDRIFRSPGLLRGHVVDFVAVGWWPVFNVADSCITIGAVMLIARTLFARE